MLLILVGMQILGKGPLKGPSDRKLLCHHKGMQCLPNGRIHIVTADMVSQMHPGMGFSHAQQRVQVTDRHRTNETPNGVLNRERETKSSSLSSLMPLCMTGWTWTRPYEMYLRNNSWGIRPRSPLRFETASVRTISSLGGSSLDGVLRTQPVADRQNPSLSTQVMQRMKKTTSSKANSVVEQTHPLTRHCDEEEDELYVSSYGRNDTNGGHADVWDSTGSRRLGWHGRWWISRWGHPMSSAF